jgi:3-phenylpropionate/cinnamic acid dioxygenase small subunit
MSCDFHEITNLLYRYAELIDQGEFDHCSELFGHARILAREGDRITTINSRDLLALWKSSIVLFEDGSARSKHVISNPIVELDDSRTRATARSYYTVFFQEKNTDPIRPIVAGRYHDRFEKVASRWRFAERDYTRIDLVGDLSGHTRVKI